MAKKTTIIITNTVSKKTREKEFTTKIAAKQWINRSNRAMKMSDSKIEYYTYK